MFDFFEICRQFSDDFIIDITTAKNPSPCSADNRFGKFPGTQNIFGKFNTRIIIRRERNCGINYFFFPFPGTFKAYMGKCVGETLLFCFRKFVQVFSQQKAGKGIGDLRSVFLWNCPEKVGISIAEITSALKFTV